MSYQCIRRSINSAHSKISSVGRQCHKRYVQVEQLAQCKNDLGAQVEKDTHQRANPISRPKLRSRWRPGLH